MPDIRQRERLFAALVIHHTQVQSSILNITVHTVDLAGQRHVALPVRTDDRRQVASARKIDLVVDGGEIRNAQFFQHVLQNVLGCARQPPEQIAEPRGTRLQPAQFLADIPLHNRTTHLTDGFLIRCRRTALRFAQLIQRMFQHIV